MNQVACSYCATLQDRHLAHCLHCCKRLFTKEHPDHVQISVQGKRYDVEIWLSDGGRFQARPTTAVMGKLAQAWTYVGALEELEKTIREHNPESQTVPIASRVSHAESLHHRKSS
jgi:hypothetical protein